MRSYAILILVLVLASGCMTTTSTADRTRQDLIARLVELTGISSQLEYQRETVRRQALGSVDGMVAQFESQFPEASVMLKDVLAKESSRYQDAVYEAWTPEEAVSELNRLYYSRFSDAELAALVAHWESPLGVKDREVSATAMREWTDWITSRTMGASVEANREFMLRLQHHIDDLSHGR